MWWSEMKLLKLFCAITDSKCTWAAAECVFLYFNFILNSTDLGCALIIGPTYGFLCSLYCTTMFSFFLNHAIAFEWVNAITSEQTCAATMVSKHNIAGYDSNIRKKQVNSNWLSQSWFICRIGIIVIIVIVVTFLYAHDDLSVVSYECMIGT